MNAQRFCNMTALARAERERALAFLAARLASAVAAETSRNNPAQEHRPCTTNIAP